MYDAMCATRDTDGYSYAACARDEEWGALSWCWKTIRRIERILELISEPICFSRTNPRYGARIHFRSE